MADHSAHAFCAENPGPQCSTTIPKTEPDFVQWLWLQHQALQMKIWHYDGVAAQQATQLVTQEARLNAISERLEKLDGAQQANRRLGRREQRQQFGGMEGSVPQKKDESFGSDDAASALHILPEQLPSKCMNGAVAPFFSPVVDSCGSSWTMPQDPDVNASCALVAPPNPSETAKQATVKTLIENIHSSGTASVAPPFPLPRSPDVLCSSGEAAHVKFPAEGSSDLDAPTSENVFGNYADGEEGHTSQPRPSGECGANATFEAMIVGLAEEMARLKVEVDAHKELEEEARVQIQATVFASIAEEVRLQVQAVAKTTIAEEITSESSSKSEMKLIEEQPFAVVPKSNTCVEQVHHCTKIHLPIIARAPFTNHWNADIEVPNEVDAKPQPLGPTGFQLVPLRPQFIPPKMFWLTCGLKQCGRSSGAFYHEVKLTGNTWCPQIGWLTDEYVGAPYDENVGVGDDKHGWAVDGVGLQTLHDAESIPAAWPRRWVKGDVIGMALNLQEGKMMFSLNSEWVDTLSINFEPTGRTFYPALSMGGDFMMYIGQHTWRFHPPNDGYQAWADGVVERPMPAS